MSTDNGNENTKRHDSERPYLKPVHLGDDDDNRKVMILLPGAVEDLLEDIFGPES